MGRKSKVEERKIEILSHFYEVISDIGFENASIAKIANRMGVNPSLLIHYFKTKEDMIIEMVDFLLRKYEKNCLNEISVIKNPQKRFEKVLDIILSEERVSNSSDLSVFYACYYLASKNDVIRERFKLMYQKFSTMLELEAKVWYEHNIIKIDDSKFVASYLIMLNEGLTYLQGLEQNLTLFKARALKTRMAIEKTLL